MFVTTDLNLFNLQKIFIIPCFYEYYTLHILVFRIEIKTLIIILKHNRLSYYLA